MVNDHFADVGKKGTMSNSESLNLKIINLENELSAMKKQLKEIKKENKRLWEYIKFVEKLAEIW